MSITTLMIASLQVDLSYIIRLVMLYGNWWPKHYIYNFSSIIFFLYEFGRGWCQTMNKTRQKRRTRFANACSIVTVCVFVCHMFLYHPFYFDFHSACVIFDVSSGFYFWNVNRTPTWHLSKMFKVAFKDASTKNSEPTLYLLNYTFCNAKKLLHF
jgi:hypothetical protein